MVEAAQAGGFNTLDRPGARTRRRLLRSGLEPRAADLAARPEFDPLAETIQRRAYARPAGPRLDRRQSRVERRRAARLAAARDLSPSRVADGAAGARRRDARAVDRAQPATMSAGWRAGRARAPTDVEGLYRLADPSWRRDPHRRALSSEHRRALRRRRRAPRLRALSQRGLRLQPWRASQQFKRSVDPELSDGRARRLPMPASASIRSHTRPLSRTLGDVPPDASRPTLVMRLRTAVKAITSGRDR